MSAGPAAVRMHAEAQVQCAAYCRNTCQASGLRRSPLLFPSTLTRGINVKAARQHSRLVGNHPHRAPIQPRKACRRSQQATAGSSLRELLLRALWAMCKQTSQSGLTSTWQPHAAGSHNHACIALAHL
jgi:hypothetical protein